MRCPECGREIEEWKLGCERCLKIRGAEDIFRMQGSHLEYVRKGHRHFYSKRLSAKHPWHLMLFQDKAHGFCGIEILQAGKNNKWDLPYSAMRQLKPKVELCEKCIYTLHQIEEQEAMKEEA
jgi:hypothetical protein